MKFLGEDLHIEKSKKVLRVKALLKNFSKNKGSYLFDVLHCYHHKEKPTRQLLI